MFHFFFCLVGISGSCGAHQVEQSKRKPRFFFFFFFIKISYYVPEKMVEILRKSSSLSLSLSLSLSIPF